MSSSQTRYGAGQNSFLNFADETIVSGGGGIEDGEEGPITLDFYTHKS